MDDKISIQVKDIPGKKGLKLIVLGGVLDTHTSSNAEESILGQINEGNGVILDCANVTYMNSVGLSTLMRFFIQAKRKNVFFKIYSPGEVMHKVIEIAGADDILDIYDSLDEALKSIEK